jgi:fermentation-respiration switch protein FrsA (DUF1100 family)
MFRSKLSRKQNYGWTLRKIATGVLLVIAMTYLAFAAMAFFASEGLIFLPHPPAYRDTPEIIKIASTNGQRISAIYLTNPAARFTLLVSHGNAEDLGDDRDWLEDLHKSGFSVFAYDYQGYGTSEGRPTEQGAYDDEEAAYNYLVTRLNVPADHIVIFGRSVGTGPAVHLAARKPVAGVILQSPFLTAFRVLTRVPLLPFDRFPNVRDIHKVRCPMLVIHGTADSVIPFWHGQKLFAAAHEPKTFFAITGADHNDLDLIGGPKYFQAILSFTNQIAR